MKKTNFPERFYSALRRNSHEIRTAILERKALIGLASAKSKHQLYFFTLSHDALFNDMIAHAIKVLDKDLKSATFWYLYRCDAQSVDSFLNQKSYDLKSLDDLASRLKNIRNKTHFHIDKEGVINPKNVWKEAGIKGNDFGRELDKIFDILNYLHLIHFGKEFPMTNYNGDDAAKLIELAFREKIIPTLHR